MLQGLAPAEAKRWLSEHAKFANLAEGDIAWVPYGFVPWMVSTSSGHSFATFTPVFSPALAGEIHESVRAASGEYIFTLLDSAVKEPRLELRETLKGFF